MKIINRLLPKTHGVAVNFGRGESFSDLEKFASSNDYYLARMKQEHGAKHAMVKNKQSQIFPKVDALITKTPNVLLAVKTADCLPVLLWHPSGVVGVIHAGRVGTTKLVTKKTLQALKNKFAVKKNLTVWLGPRICSECYQIDKKTDEHFDLVSENIKQVQTVFSDSQVKIINSEHCTVHHNQQWYSYRKEGKGVNMNWFGIGLH